MRSPAARGTSLSVSLSLMSDVDHATAKSIATAGPMMLQQQREKERD